MSINRFYDLNINPQVNIYYETDTQNIQTYNYSINTSYFNKNLQKQPRVCFSARGQESEMKVQAVINMFKALSPKFKHIPFLHLKGYDKQTFATLLSESTFTLYTDEIACIATLPLESMAANTHVIGWDMGVKDYAGDNPMQGIRQWWEGGIYENTYKKVDGVWRIHILDYAPQWHADYETGWAHTRPNYVPFLDKTIPEDPTGPDVLKDGVWLWPTHKVVPFHNAHPVTGAPIVPERWQGDIDREKAAK
jgi:hypothetical protein